LGDVARPPGTRGQRAVVLAMTVFALLAAAVVLGAISRMPRRPRG
jgi:hypothetical protein